VANTGANYNTNNQITGGLIKYDPAGDVTGDAHTGNTYLYDGEGRICAVKSEPVGSTYTTTGYIYDADGARVAKGTITNWSGGCNPDLNGFQPTSDYILGLGGEQAAEMSMGGTTSGGAATSGMVWQHTNVYAAGALIATYDNDGLHFYFNDPLGSRRAQTDYAGVLEQTCSSLPYGDQLTCTGSVTTPTEHHFTGKERDSESGNDYFGARYYASSMGRFMSPDPSQLYYADPTNPQSLNLYNYGQNNPITNNDSTGMDCVYETQNTGDPQSTTAVSVIRGDCKSESDNGYYINCDGCVYNAAGANLDTPTGTLTFTDQNGKAIADDSGNVAAIQGFADPQGVSASVTVGGTSWDVSATGYGFGQLSYFPGAAYPYNFPNGELRPYTRSEQFYNWFMKWGGVVGCLGGLDADNMKPFGDKSDGPKDSSDSTDTTTGQGTIYGPKKGGGTMPYNPNGNPEGAQGAASAPGLITNGIACIQNSKKL
jgi:RHS repeat-associated protein